MKIDYFAGKIKNLFRRTGEFKRERGTKEKGAGRLEERVSGDKQRRNVEKTAFRRARNLCRSKATETVTRSRRYGLEFKLVLQKFGEDVV